MVLISPKMLRRLSWLNTYWYTSYPVQYRYRMIYKNANRGFHCYPFDIAKPRPFWVSYKEGKSNKTNVLHVKSITAILHKIHTITICIHVHAQTDRHKLTADVITCIVITTNCTRHVTTMVHETCTCMHLGKCTCTYNWGSMPFLMAFERLTSWSFIILDIYMQVVQYSL